MENITAFIEKKLFLKVNREKSTVAYIRESKISWLLLLQKQRRRAASHTPKSVRKDESQNQRTDSRSNGWGNAQKKGNTRQYITGWVNYFKLADMKTLMIETENGTAEG